MFDSVNQQVADIATQVGQTPQGWNGSIFSMIQNLSNSIMVPIAGVILAIVMDAGADPDDYRPQQPA